jgi:hypothetical protein
MVFSQVEMAHASSIFNYLGSDEPPCMEVGNCADHGGLDSTLMGHAQYRPCTALRESPPPCP